MPGISAITKMMLMEKIAPKFGDDWPEVAIKYRAFIREEASNLISEAGKSPEKEKKRNIDLVETRSIPSTQKKNGRIKSVASVSMSLSCEGNPKCERGDCLDDFREEPPKNPGPSRKKKIAKYVWNEEPLTNKASALKPSCTAEIVRLKAPAKQCG